MQSAAVPCTSNGMKRTAANALLTESESDVNLIKQHNDYKTTDTDNSSHAISPPPPEKRSFIVVESPLKLDTIDSAEDLDIKVLKIQNKNLSERLIQRKRLEEDLKEKIDLLQNRKLADDSKLCIIDRYWTQLDENLRLMLERFDNTSENTPAEMKPTSLNVRNFLAKLNDWDKVEIEDNLKDRVKFTTQTVAKLITNYDRIGKRNEAYYKDKDNEVLTENIRLNELVTKLQQKSHLTGLEKKTLEDSIVKLETEIKELTSKNDLTEYDLDKFRDKAFKLDRQLADTIIKLNNLQKYNQSILDQTASATSQSSSNSQYDKNGQLVLHTNMSNPQMLRSESTKSTNMTDKQISEMETELEEYKELSTSRLLELEKFNVQYQASLKQIEKLKADIKLVPESAISESSEYKHLQSKYSLVVSDNIKLKAALDESKVLIETSRVTFQRQLEAMESDELNQQKRLGNEMMQLEEQLTKVRQENELLRIEYEQNVAANEQTGPINKEMRSLITTLQTNNKLLKSDNVRTKKRLEEILQEYEKMKKQLAQLQLKMDANKTSCKNDTDQGSMTDSNKSQSNATKEASQIKELKELNQKLAEDKKELKGLLETYKQSNKQASSPNVSNAKPHKSFELDDAKAEIKRLKEMLDRSKSNKSNSTEHSSNGSSNSNHDSDPSQNSSNNTTVTEYLKKIKSLDENIRELHKNLNSKKQEETALLNDMEITGQAFEDMQEQNVRLMQQLREKDDANFKLVSERIKLENVEKNLKEEKEIYVQQVLTLQEQLETQMCIAKKLDEQLLLSNQTILIIEKEKAQLQHSCENYRRQAFDHSQLVQDLKLNIQKYLSQLKEVQQQIAEKSEALASQSFMNKRSQEEIKHLQMKIERQKKFEMASSMDEVLQEEIKEYKEQLRCPSCKVKQKDAVLTKCFHVFCFDCLQKRYDTRQRKCPKCNANFGANDFRKLYLS